MLPLPLRYLTKLEKEVPVVREEVDASKLQDDTPPMCFLDHGAAFVNLVNNRLLTIDTDGKQYVKMPEGVSARDLNCTLINFMEVFTWGYSRGIYRFDRTIYEEIINTPLEGLPGAVLLRLPEWCVYIQTPNIVVDKNQIDGFWATISWIDKKYSLRLLLLNKQQNQSGMLNVPIGTTDVAEYLSRGGSLPERFASHEELTQWANEWKPMLSLVGYLCAENADWTGVAERPVRLPQRRPRHLPPRISNMGVRDGAVFRAYNEQEHTVARQKQHIQKGSHM